MLGGFVPPTASSLQQRVVAAQEELLHAGDDGRVAEYHRGEDVPERQRQAAEVKRRAQRARRQQRRDGDAHRAEYHERQRRAAADERGLLGTDQVHHERLRPHALDEPASLEGADEQRLTRGVERAPGAAGDGGAHEEEERREGEDAFVLADGARERDLWDLDLYKQGKIYLQSLSSMLPPLALSPRAGADILDMCAAPGGKTSQMAALAPGGDGVRAARVTACEVSKPRAEKLEHNLAKLGAKNVQVMRTDASKLDDWFSFDQILLDAPCTGSGTVHVQDDHAARYLTPALASGVERSQRALIDKALRVLKPGGELVYSTCSVLARENEDVVSWALSRHKDCELVGAGLPAGALGSEEFSVPTLSCGLDGALTVCPSDLFEGFFLAKIRKLG